MIGVTGALTGHPDDRWRLYFMLVWSSLCAVAVGLGLVGYRRRALRMRFVVMDLAVNEDQDPWQLLRDGTISFKEFEKIHARQIARRFLGTP